MGASSSVAAASAIPTNREFRRGKLACRFLMISNCGLAVYIITRPRNRERIKGGTAGAPPAPDEAPRNAQQQQQQQQISDPAGAEVRIEEH